MLSFQKNLDVSETENPRVTARERFPLGGCSARARLSDSDVCGLLLGSGRAIAKNRALQLQERGFYPAELSFPGQPEALAGGDEWDFSRKHRLR